MRQQWPKLRYQILIYSNPTVMFVNVVSRVSCQKGPTRNSYTWPIGPFWQYTLDIRTLLLYINIRTLCLIFSIYPRYSPSLLYFLLPPLVSLGMACSIFRAIRAMIYRVIISTQGTYDPCWIMVQINNLQCASYFTIFVLYNAMSKSLTEISKRISDIWYVLRYKIR